MFGNENHGVFLPPLGVTGKDVIAHAGDLL